MAHRVLDAATWCGEVGNGREDRLLPTVISSDCPEIAGLAATAPGVEHRAAGLVGKNFQRGFQDCDEPLVQRLQFVGGEPGLVCER